MARQRRERGARQVRERFHKSLSHTHTRTHAHFTHAHAHTRTHAHTHTRKHARKHTCIPANMHTRAIVLTHPLTNICEERFQVILESKLRVRTPSVQQCAKTQNRFVYYGLQRLAGSLNCYFSVSKEPCFHRALLQERLRTPGILQVVATS